MIRLPTLFLERAPGEASPTSTILVPDRLHRVLRFPKLDTRRSRVEGKLTLCHDRVASGRAASGRETLA